VSPIQLVPKDKVVCGVRLNLVSGNNAKVWGIDAGLVNITGAFSGLQIGLLNGFVDWLDPTYKISNATSYGLQLGGADTVDNMTGGQVGLTTHAGIMNGVQVGVINVGLDMAGIQVGGVGNYSRNMTGIQIGTLGNIARQVWGVQVALILNANVFVDSNMSGVQLGLVNAIGGLGHLSGVQIGLVNAIGGHMTGVQVGLINTCTYLTGVQIGLINIASSGERAIPFLPLMNVGFY